MNTGILILFVSYPWNFNAVLTDKYLRTFQRIIIIQNLGKILQVAKVSSTDRFQYSTKYCDKLGLRK